MSQENSKEPKNTSQNTSALERSELFRILWDAANTLRGSLDGWDFKTYVLGLLFYRFISENITQYVATFAGGKNYTQMHDEEISEHTQKEKFIKEKGFYIAPSQLFCNVVRLGSDTVENINEILKNIFASIESSALGTASEHVIRGLFYDIDLNSQKLGKTVLERNKKILSLLATIDSLPLSGSFGENSIDLFGDAYEYLMTMYASQAGKSG